jgi:hypothetical protein
VDIKGAAARIGNGADEIAREAIGLETAARMALDARPRRGAGDVRRCQYVTIEAGKSKRFYLNPVEKIPSLAMHVDACPDRRKLATPGTRRQAPACLHSRLHDIV